MEPPEVKVTASTTSVQHNTDQNTADFNGQDGIYVTDTSTLDGGGNTAKGNDYIAGNPPEQCRGVVCG